MFIEVLRRYLQDLPPARWRIQVAANLLAQSAAKVATIGSEVGYDSEAAFSRAFKKETGVAPGAWRAGRPDSGRASRRYVNELT